jgi:hypothetical protein
MILAGLIGLIAILSVISILQSGEAVEDFDRRTNTDLPFWLGYGHR